VWKEGVRKGACERRAREGAGGRMKGNSSPDGWRECVDDDDQDKEDAHGAARSWECEEVDHQPSSHTCAKSCTAPMG